MTTPSPWPMVGWACAGVVVAPLSALWLPGFVLAQVGVGVLSAGYACWGLLGVAQDRRHRHELGKARWFRMTVDQLITAAPATSKGQPQQVYLGMGALLDRRHAQALFDLTSSDRDAILQDTRTEGDNRVIGIAWRDLASFFQVEKVANRHILIYGASGCGKTRAAEMYGLQAILRFHYPVVVVDPKGDQDLRRRMQAAAQRAGVPFYCVDFADPEHSATYNPLAGYTDPDQVGEQIFQLCDHGTGSDYWRGRAANTAKIVARAMDSVRRYLEACGGSGATPPQVLAELERGRGHVTLPVQFSPFGWYPRLSILDLYGVTAVHRLLGWMLRIVYADRLEKDPDAPDYADKATIETWWTAYLSDRSHADDALPERQKLLDAIRIQLRAIHDLMSREEEELAKANSSLFEALERFRGRASCITETPTPDIVWDRVMEQRAVVYFSLAAQEYSDLASGFARLMCADLSAWCGKQTRTIASPWYLIADEVDRWIPSTFIDFLARGRSAGLRSVAIGQTRASFAERLGQHGREMMEGNVGTVIQFSAKGPSDAAAAAKYSGTTQITRIRTGSTTSSSAAVGPGGRPTGDGHQVSHSVQTDVQECETFPAWAVQNLPIGSALVVTQHGPAIVTFPEIVD